MKWLFHGDTCWQLNFDLPLEQQGPFDVILHKLTDQIARSPDGSPLTVKHMEAVQVVSFIYRMEPKVRK